MTEGELGRKVYLDSGTLAPLLKWMDEHGDQSRKLQFVIPEG